MARQVFAQVGTCARRQVFQLGEIGTQQAQQVEEGIFIAAVWRSRQQDHVALSVFCEAFEQLVTLLTTLAPLGAGVGFVHDDEFRAEALEGLATAFGLDVVQTDHGEGLRVEDRGAWRQVTLQPVGGAGSHHHGLDVEAFFQFSLPLFAQVGRAQHGHALDFAAVQHFAGNQAALDGLADTHVVGNQQAYGALLHRHQQWHQLVGPGLHRDVAEAAERASATAQLELQGVHQQLAG